MEMGGGSMMGGDGMGMTMPPPGMGMMMPPPPSSGNDGMHMQMDHKMMMHMTFFWGHRVDVLFSGWPGDRGVGMYILALFVVFVASALVECFTYVPHGLLTTRGGKSLPNGLILTALAAVRTGLSYLVMLAVMSFNVGVLIAAIAGHALGFFVFGSNCLFKWLALPPVADEAQPGGHQAAILPAKC